MSPASDRHEDLVDHLTAVLVAAHREGLEVGLAWMQARSRATATVLAAEGRARREQHAPLARS